MDNARLVADRRAAHGLSRARMARRLGLPESAVSATEAGTRRLAGDDLASWLLVLGERPRADGTGVERLVTRLSDDLEAEVREFAGLSPSQRLIRGFAFSRLAAEMHGTARATQMAVAAALAARRSGGRRTRALRPPAVAGDARAQPGRLRPDRRVRGDRARGARATQDVDIVPSLDPENCVDVAVAGRDDLIAMKAAAGRPRDLDEIEQLTRLEAPEAPGSVRPPGPR